MKRRIPAGASQNRVSWCSGTTRVWRVAECRTEQKGAYSSHSTHLLAPYSGRAQGSTGGTRYPPDRARCPGRDQPVDGGADRGGQRGPADEHVKKDRARVKHRRTDPDDRGRGHAYTRLLHPGIGTGSPGDRYHEPQQHLPAAGHRGRGAGRVYLGSCHRERDRGAERPPGPGTGRKRLHGAGFPDRSPGYGHRDRGPDTPEPPRSARYGCRDRYRGYHKT